MSRRFTGSPPTPSSPLALALRHFSAPNASPDTLTPTCLPTSQSDDGHSRQKSNRHATPATFTTRRTALFFFLINFCVSYFGSPPSCRTSLLGYFYNLHLRSRGSTRAGRQQKRNKTRLFPVTRPHVYSQNTISRCQGKSRSGRPVALFGAPLNLPRVYRLARV